MTLKRTFLPALAALVAAFSLPAWGQGLPSTIYNSSPPTLSNGQQAPLQADVNGNLKTTATITSAGSASNATDGQATSTTNGQNITFPYLWNGATFDRWKGDATNGAFVQLKGTLPAFAATPTVNVGTDSSVPSTGTGGTSAVTVGTTSAQASAAATRTARLVVKNESATASIACNLGGTAALNTAGNFTIAPGQMLTLSDAAYVPGDALNCIASAASTPATVWSK